MAHGVEVRLGAHARGCQPTVLVDRGLTAFRVDQNQYNKDKIGLDASRKTYILRVRCLLFCGTYEYTQIPGTYTRYVYRYMYFSGCFVFFCMADLFCLSQLELYVHSYNIISCYTAYLGMALLSSH